MLSKQKKKNSHMAGCIVPEYNLSRNSDRLENTPKQKKEHFAVISDRMYPAMHTVHIYHGSMVRVDCLVVQLPQWHHLTADQTTS